MSQFAAPIAQPKPAPRQDFCPYCRIFVGIRPEAPPRLLTARLAPEALARQNRQERLEHALPRRARGRAR